MKVLFLVGMTMLLCCCEDTSNLNLARFEYLCENKGGYYDSSGIPIGGYRVKCNDGSVIRIDDIDEVHNSKVAEHLKKVDSE